MKAKKPLLLIALLAVVLALAFAPGALAKGQTVDALGTWTTDYNDYTIRFIPPTFPTIPPSDRFHEFVKGSQTGQWTGTFTASNTYEPFLLFFTTELDPITLEPVEVFWANQLIHFYGVAVDMDPGPEEQLLYGDMTMRAIFRPDTCREGGTWKIQNGTGDLKHLGGEGTFVWSVGFLNLDYFGTIWLNK